MTEGMTQEKNITTIEVKQVEGLVLVGKGNSNHWVIMDQKKQFGGTEAGSAPMELVLMALAGCTAMDVISLLKKMRVNYWDFKVTAEAHRAEEHPKVYTDIRLIYHVSGKEIPLSKLQKAVNLSMERYCPITTMLKESVDISYEIKVHDECNDQ